MKSDDPRRWSVQKLELEIKRLQRIEELRRIDKEHARQLQKARRLLQDAHLRVDGANFDTFSYDDLIDIAYHTIGKRKGSYYADEDD